MSFKTIIAFIVVAHSFIIPLIISYVDNDDPVRRQMLPKELPKFGGVASIKSIAWCKDLGWRNPRTPNITALVAAPGSGNTWLRYLLQQATGIVTGSIYLDLFLQSNGFPAENIFNGSVLLVKTHEGPRHNYFFPKYRSAVMLVREPRKSILAAFNYKMAGRIGIAPRESFEVPNHLILGNTGTDSWDEFAYRALDEWKNLYTSWLLEFSGPIHIVFYEDLVDDTNATLRGILDFLDYTVAEDDMSCALQRKEGVFRRQRMDFDPFTPAMDRAIAAERGKVYRCISARYKTEKSRVRQSLS